MNQNQNQNQQISSAYNPLPASTLKDYIPFELPPFMTPSQQEELMESYFKTQHHHQFKNSLSFFMIGGNALRPGPDYHDIYIKYFLADQHQARIDTVERTAIRIYKEIDFNLSKQDTDPTWGHLNSNNMRMNIRLVWMTLNTWKRFGDILQKRDPKSIERHKKNISPFAYERLIKNDKNLSRGRKNRILIC